MSALSETPTDWQLRPSRSLPTKKTMWIVGMKGLMTYIHAWIETTEAQGISPQHIVRLPPRRDIWLVASHACSTMLSYIKSLPDGLGIRLSYSQTSTGQTLSHPQTSLVIYADPFRSTCTAPITFRVQHVCWYWKQLALWNGKFLACETRPKPTVGTQVWLGNLDYTQEPQLSTSQSTLLHVWEAEHSCRSCSQAAGMRLIQFVLTVIHTVEARFGTITPSHLHTADTR